MKRYSRQLYIHFATIAVLLFIFLFRSSSLEASFILFDSIGQQNKPDLWSENGYPLIRTIPARWLWPKSAESMESPDLSHVELFAKSLHPSLNLLCLDIEHWDLKTQSETELNRYTNYLISIINTIKRVRPDIKVGYYGILPIRDYHTPVRANPVQVANWHTLNNRLSPLADVVDIIFPSLYTFYANSRDWKIYAKANIEEAKKYGKPVIPFLWPQYHVSNNFRGLTFINGEYWKTQLETVYQNADGVIIWTPWGQQLQTKWNENAEWWIATKTFGKNKKLTRCSNSDTFHCSAPQPKQLP
jgi:hypothetical protein